MSDLQLTAGVGRIDITPPVGFRLEGAMRRVDPSVGVESPLLATALVLADERTKIVLLDCDLVGFDMPLAAKIRQVIADRVGTSPGCVAVGCTHTHNGPCTARGILGGVHHVAGDPAEIQALDAYIEDLVNRLAGLAVLADGDRRPARAAAGSGHAKVAVNREERAPEDGLIVVGRNPDGTTDHSVDVLRVDDLDGNPIAVVAGYAAHPVVMGYETHLLSQDFPGVVRRVVEQATGATCLYLTGAAGNQACYSFLQSDWGEKERTGGIVGAAALQAFYGIETRPHEEIRERGLSLSRIALYHKEFKDGPTHKVLSAASRQVALPLQPLPSLDQAEAQYAEAAANVRKLVGKGADTTEVCPAQLVEVWAKGVLDKVRAGVREYSLSFDIVAFRLDDFVLVAQPGEPFVEIGLGVKERSKAKHTMFGGYCNGVLAYLPTAATVAQGGMSVEAAVRTYDIPAPPVAETVDLLVEEYGELLNEVGL